MRRESEEVYYPELDVVRAGPDEMRALKEAAERNARRRSRLCAHPGPGDVLHEMLIVHDRSCYVRPHRHVGKSESLLLLEGELDAVFFDDAGNVTERRPMGAYGGGDDFYYRIPERVWHTLLIRSAWVVFLEVTSGPFRREQTEFAPWAPSGEDPAEVARFLNALRAGAAP